MRKVPMKREAVEERVEQLIRLITTRNYENRTPERMRAYAVDLGLLRPPSTHSPQKGRGGAASA
jgi:hypothetical protein